ncbi:OmpA family protein [Ekhidna sp.]|uniref:OmpA family protein n=1 Tax=Ekhidna sp. TaxID=2608089 RepID=UPI003BAD742F
MRVLITIIGFWSVLHLQSQTITFSSTTAADAAFENYSYARAVELYKASLESTEDSLYLLQQLGLCFQNMNDTKKAEMYFSMVVSYPESPAEYSYFYAQTLASNSKYNEAKEWYKNYQNKVKDDPRAADKLKALENLNSFFSDSAKFEIKRMEFNSPGLDFSPAIYQNGVVFASSRPTGNSWIKTNFNWDESRFLDLYQAKPNADNAELFIDHIQTKYHEGPLAFYENEQKVVFTRNNVQGKRLKKDGEGVTRLKLFFAESDGKGGWKNIQPFEYNSDDYSVGHPAINENGTVMIFSSDMEGSLGQSDLYIVFREGDKWTKPKNLGSKVNTAGKEMFPSLVSNNLYFASDGRGGLGGLDVFEANLNRVYDVIKVNNIGYPINSSKDDFGLVSNDNFRSGYFTSARIDSLKDDIYYFERDYYQLRGVVLNAVSREPIQGADVFIQSENDNQFYRRSALDGSFLVEDIEPMSWEVSGVKYEYQKSAIKKLNIEEDKAEYQIEILLSPHEKFPVDLPAPLEEYLKVVSVESLTNDASTGYVVDGDTLSVNPIYYDFDKSELRVEGKEELDNLIRIMNKYPNLIIGLFSHTDIQGNEKYNLILSQRRANAAADYLIENGIHPELIQPTGKGESTPAIDCSDCTIEIHQKNRRTEFVIVGVKNE